MQTNDEYFEAFKDSIEQVWAKKLVLEFAVQQHRVDKALHKSLEYPVFAFTSATKKWGTWDASTRTITLSHHLLKHYEWDAVVHTLKHEMAHMIVSEIWVDIDKKGHSHGELFKKACDVMGIDSKGNHNSCEKSSYTLPESEKIASKIHKLFCLGESNHKAESENAITKAYELMAKYNISFRELPSEKRTFVFRPVGKIYTKVPDYVVSLARTVSTYYFVKHIYITHEHSHYFRRGPGNKRYIEFYGEPHNVDIAEYVFHFLLLEGERQWKAFQKSDKYLNRFNSNDDSDTDCDNDFEYRYGRKRKNRKAPFSKVAFLKGLYAGFDEKLYDRQKEVKVKIETEGNKLPLLASDALLEEKYQSHYRPVSWHSSREGSCGGGWGDGKEVGKNITIRQGVARHYGDKQLISA